MKVSRGNAIRAIAAAVSLSAIAFVLLVEYAPGNVPFSPDNYGWNGLQNVASTYRVNFTTSLATVPPNAVLVVTQPSTAFSSDDAAAVKTFLQGGGTVLVADKSGVANTLLVRLDSAISIENQYSLTDSTYNWKSSSLPTALVLPEAVSKFRFLRNVTGIALNKPAPLLVSAAATGLAITSQFSTSSASGGPRGPFIVMAAQRYGKGTLVVVGDSQFLLNSEWTLANNMALIGNLFGNTQVFVDASHWGVSSTAVLRLELSEFYGAISGFPMRYVITLLVAGFALVLVPGREPSQLRPKNAGQGGMEE
jgi:hypothetical protein